jgi:hypothetical protein
VLKVLLSCLLFLSFCACSEKKEEENSNSDVASFTANEAAGNMTSACTIINDGSVLNNTSYVQTYSLNADGTYSMSINFFSSTQCQNGGGYNFISFSQSGIWSVDGAGAVSNSSNIKFTVNGAPNLTVYGATSLGHDIAGYLNAACATTFNHSATKSLDMTDLNCIRASSPTFNWTFPGTTGTVGTIGVLSSTPSKTLKIAQPSIIWYPGDFGSYPSSVNFTLTYY